MNIYENKEKISNLVENFRSSLVLYKNKYLPNSYNGISAFILNKNCLSHGGHFMPMTKSISISSAVESYNARIYNCNITPFVTISENTNINSVPIGIIYDNNETESIEVSGGTVTDYYINSKKELDDTILNCSKFIRYPSMSLPIESIVVFDMPKTLLNDKTIQHIKKYIAAGKIPLILTYSTDNENGTRS